MSALEPQHEVQPAHPRRATQGFVGTITWTARHPAALLIEIGWRWLFGIPALLLCWQAASRVLDAVPWQSSGILKVTPNALLTDPMAASVAMADFVNLVLPGVLHTFRWLAPLMLCAWIALSTVGRTLLLRRMDSRLHGRWLTMLLLQAARIVPLVLVAVAWWYTVQWLAHAFIAAPLNAGGEPQIMVYVAGVIVISLGLFVLTGSLSWTVTAAPVLAMRDGTGPLRSLRSAATLKQERGSMFEINLVLSVVKIMLVVLAMAFSAFPLPFTSVLTEGYVLTWSALVAAAYFAGSDFFHVARLAAFVHLLLPLHTTSSANPASHR